MSGYAVTPHTHDSPTWVMAADIAWLDAEIEAEEVASNYGPISKREFRTMGGDQKAAARRIAHGDRARRLRRIRAALARSADVGEAGVSEPHSVHVPVYLGGGKA